MIRQMPFAHANLMWMTALTDVLLGDRVAPRGQRTREIRGVTLTLDNPHRNVITVPARRLNHTFMVAEFIWILTGRRDVGTIAYFNKNIAQFSDDGATFSGAYGPMVTEQLAYVLATLRTDPNSRQALLTIWRQRPGPAKDVPCTALMQFMIRHGRLEMDVYMRSNDLWLGFPYDVFTFTMIQKFVASALAVSAGSYRHHVGSLHLYEQHWGKANTLLLDPASNVRSPFIPPFLDVEDIVPSYVEEDYLRYSSDRWLLSYFTDNYPELIKEHLEERYIRKDPLWGDLLKVLAFRTHKQTDLLPEPWRTVEVAYGR